jgi:uncharacterized protein RhaS with RHS repeats
MKLNVIANRTFWLMLGWLVVAMPAHAFYDPSLGRWLNRDPLEEEDGANLYQFVHNAPVSSMDQDGRQSSTANPGFVVAAAEAEALSLGYPSVEAMKAAIQAAAMAVAIAEARCRIERCKKERQQAYEDCEKGLAQPNPGESFKPRNWGNKPWTIDDCVRGRLSEECGGNPTKPPPEKKPKEWIFK